MTTMEAGHTIPVHDHGFVRYIDHMGTDERMVEAARISYRSPSKGEEADRKLLAYLLKNKHTSPFEMCKITFNVKLPIFVMRQWVRHRMQCLSGDTELYFDLPTPNQRGRTKLYKLKLRDVYKKWQPTSGEQGDPLFKRQRVQNMRLRSVNEETGELLHTSIADCWESGLKQVYDVALSSGCVARMSADHRVFTDTGWKTLREVMAQPDALVGCVMAVPKRVVRVEPEFTETELAAETWRYIQEGYEVSDLGRVRSWVNTRGIRQPMPKLKVVTATKSGHKVVSLSKDAVSMAAHVHVLVLNAFVGPCPAGHEALHGDGNGFNNRVSNLRWGTKSENQREKTAAGSVPSLSLVFQKVVSIESAGEEMTYDIEVAGPWRNFVANGMVVHNSLNEVSARYTELPAEFYVPASWRRQDTKNKQGSVEAGAWDPVVVKADKVVDFDARSVTEFPELTATELVRGHYATAYDTYQKLLAAGVAREMARIVLPVGIYTEIYSCWDLNNLLKFFALRDDAHAQAEIQDYARAMKEITAQLFPWTMQVYEEMRKPA